MARAVAKRFKAPLALIDKRRPKPNISEVMNVIGEVAGRNLLILDDLIDTGGTIVEAATALKAKGARDIYVGCTHGILSGEALSRIQASPVTELVVTNTIPIRDGAENDKVRVLSVAPVLGEAVRRIHNGESVSSLFD
jgi:ribose-phosphate pyrophosphokinase